MLIMVLCVFYYIWNEFEYTLGRGLLERKAGLRPPVIFTDRSKAVLLLWFILIVILCPLSVSLWLFVDFV